MSCTSKSENRFTGLLRSASTVEFPVVKLGVWHNAQPTWLNTALPLLIDVAPPGEVVEGVGAARKRMKNANFSIALIASSGAAPSVLVTSFGTVANWQDAVSSRSVWNSSLVMPISTL